MIFGPYYFVALKLVGLRIKISVIPKIEPMISVDANPTKFNEVATFSAPNNRTWNHPVISRPYLLIRNDREAVCFKLPLVANGP